MRKRQRDMITVLAMVVTVSVLCLACMFVPDEKEAITKDGMTLVWEDTFDYTGVPDTTKWKYQTGAGGWGNNELQNYLDNTTTATTAIVSDGTLKIKAFKKDGTWVSARMNSKESWTYGYIEARMKVTDTNGAWPAFWMMPQNNEYGTWPASGEIDIMENAASTCGVHTVFSTLHAQGHSAENGAGIGKKTYSDALKDEYHTFAVKWTEKEITAIYDGEVMSTYLKGDKTWKDWPYDKDFHIILNLAIGGNLGGTADAQTLDSAVFEIDYVRVYQ